jgi:NAD(P)H-hydrate repair Nnr-like enzyme with NAD(P)H-hydrate epimerase domain
VCAVKQTYETLSFHLMRFARFDFVVDALFGFSYRGAPRPPFDALLRMLCAADAPPLASIDVPSGVCHRFSCCVRLR